MAPVVSWVHDESFQGSSGASNSQVAVRGSSGHGDTMSSVMRTGDQGGSRGVVTAWSRGVHGYMCS